MNIKNIAIEIMNIEQMIDDEISADGSPLSNEELDALYSELKKLHNLKNKRNHFQDMEVEIFDNPNFKIKK